MGLLRFILAISVVIAHSSPFLDFKFLGGKLAVQAFYIISGFYMTLVLNEKYIGNKKSYKLFISNRFLRLFPIYWATLLLTIIFYVGIIGINAGVSGNYFYYYDKISFGSLIFLVFTNLFIFFQDAVMFLGLDMTTGDLFFTSNFRDTQPQLHSFLFIPQAWTLGVELVFYVIAPFLVRRKLHIIIPIIFLSLLLRFVLYNYGLKNDPWIHRFFPTALVFFLFGAVSYHLFVILRRLEIERIYLKIVWGIIIGFTLFYSFFSMTYKSEFYLFLISLSIPFLFLLTNKWKVDAHIGELSYPIYISHILVKKCIIFFKLPTPLGLGFSLTIATIILSIALNELIAKKIERIRQRRVLLA